VLKLEELLRLLLFCGLLVLRRLRPLGLVGLLVRYPDLKLIARRESLRDLDLRKRCPCTASVEHRSERRRAERAKRGEKRWLRERAVRANIEIAPRR